jgi:thiamine biosynthesis protein ThiS
MNLIINGDERLLSAQTLSALVEELGMKSDRVAIELNREIVHKEQWAQTQLHDGDRLEIVHFVGGGARSAHRVVGPSGDRRGEQIVCG